MRMRLVLLACLGTLLVVPGLAAQNDGDAVVAVYNSPVGDLLLVTPNGVVTTLITRPNTNLPEGLAVAPGNDGGLFVETDTNTRVLSVLKFQNAANVSTLATLPTTFARVPTLLAEQGGEILMLNMSGNDRGVYRMPAQGGPITTIAHNTLGATFLAPFSMEEDLVTGDIVVLEPTRYFHRIDRTGKVTTIAYTLPPSTSIAVTGNVHVDYATGLLYLTYGNYLIGLDSRTGATTTIFQPTTSARSMFYGIDGDPYGGGFYLSVYQTTPTPAGRYLMRYDTRSGILSTVATLSAANTTQLSDVMTWKSRMLTGLSRPAWGQSYALRLSIPSEAGQGYFAAAALGTLQGIPIGKLRRIPLDPDPLFFLSMQVPAIFSGFQGILDTWGRASPAVNVPAIPQLAGIRIFLAAVTYDAGGIREITEPLGVTIE
jgi:hypothetical protein